MTTPGINPPTDSRSGRIGALRDNYGRRKAAKPPKGERRPWWRRKRAAN
jgi:hypothetical protein